MNVGKREKGIILAGLSWLVFFGCWITMVWAVGNYVYHESGKSISDIFVSFGIIFGGSAPMGITWIIFYILLDKRYGIEQTEHKG